MTEIRKFTIRSIKLKDKYFDGILNKTKVSTIRLGYLFIRDINIQLTFDSKPNLNAKIKNVDYSKTFGTISIADARNDGYLSLDELKSDLRKYYPDIAINSPITIIYFEPID